MTAYLESWQLTVFSGPMFPRHQMETFSALLALCEGNHRSPVDSPHKGQWRGALMFSLIGAWTNGWANNRDDGSLRCYRAHYDVTVMKWHERVLKTHRFFCQTSNYLSWKLLIAVISETWLRKSRVLHHTGRAPQAGFRGTIFWRVETTFLVIQQRICVRNYMMVDHLISNTHHVVDPSPFTHNSHNYSTKIHCGGSPVVYEQPQSPDAWSVCFRLQLCR